jgi:3-deoxy-D-manno-octulosonate 8-phosphate phosphatase (KDO 8-P phosphatase)
MPGSKPETISILGSGNVATFLALALHKAGYAIDCVFSRTLSGAQGLAEKVNAAFTSDITGIPESSIWIFAMTDRALADTVAGMGFRKSFLIHTAGSLPLDILAGHSDDYGVLYPLQTISGRKDPMFSDMPLCIEAANPDALARLESLAQAVSPVVHRVDSEKRLLLHLGAVFACNFTNHMYALAQEISGKAGLPFELYHPLIRETTEKAVTMGPFDSQTGPAARNDEIIIQKHVDMLYSSAGLREIYEKVTGSIRDMSARTGEKSVLAATGAGSRRSGNAKQDKSDSDNMIEKKSEPERLIPEDQEIPPKGAPRQPIPGNHEKKFFKEELSRVRAFAFDVDGVFSDGILLMDPNGELTRSMNIKDGFAMHLAARKGYPIAIITGGNSEQVRKRFNMLGVHDVYLKSSSKLVDFMHFCNKYDIDPGDVLYMGDDLPDYPVMQKAGFPACPADAVPEIKQIARYVSAFRGGHGCVRDVLEQVLRVHGVWMSDDSFIL